MVDNIDTTMALAAKHLVHALSPTLMILHPVTCDPPIYQECLVSFAAGGDTIIMFTVMVTVGRWITLT